MNYIFRLQYLKSDFLMIGIWRMAVSLGQLGIVRIINLRFFFININNHVYSRYIFTDVFHIIHEKITPTVSPQPSPLSIEKRKD